MTEYASLKVRMKYKLFMKTLTAFKKQVKKYPLLPFLFTFFVCVLITTFLLYFKLWRSYFTQDEWFYFSLFNPYLSDPFGFLEVFIQQFTNPKLYGIHFTPLWNSLFFLEYQIFGVKYQYYALLAMILHVVASMLVFLLGYRLTKSRFVAFATGLSFAIASSLYEGLTWANAHLQSQIPSILIIISLLLWVQGLEKIKERFLFLSIILLIFALLIKESVFGMFFVMFCMIFMYGVKKNYRKGITLLVGGFLLYTCFRVIAPFIALQFDSSRELASPFPLFDPAIILFRLILYPFKAIIQYLFSVEGIIAFSEALTKWNYPTFYGKDAAQQSAEYTNFVYSAGSDMAMILLTIPTVFVLLGVFKKLKKSKNVLILNAFVFAVIFIFGSVFPIVFLAPWLLTIFPFVTFIESRYFYLTGIGISLLFAIVSLRCFIYILSLKKRRVLRMSLLALFSICLAVLFARELHATRTAVLRVISIGEERHIITDYIKAVYPRLQNRSIFFITSNKPYFGFSEHIVPFQTNFGATLLTIYFREMRFDSSFYDHQFLLGKGVNGEGYKELQGRGFGYFTKGESLLKALGEENLTTKNVYAFHYDGNRKIISSTTDEIRSRIAQEHVYEKSTRRWKKYEDIDGNFSFLYPPEYTVFQRSDAIQENIEIRRVDGELAYTLSIPKQMKREKLDDFSSLFGTNDESWKHATSGKTSMYFSSLVKREVTFLIKDNQAQYFFYHPKSYIILRIESTHSKSADKTDLPLDLFLWTLRFS